MMAVRKLLLLYIRNEMIRGLTQTGSGVEGLSVEHLHPQTSLEGPPWDDVYVTIFTYFASIEVGLYFHTGAFSNLLISKHHPLWLLSIDLPKYTRLCEIVRPHQLINILFTGLPAPLNSLVPLAYSVFLLPFLVPEGFANA